MDDEERDSAENLLLLCPTHHTVVDKNPDEYPPAVLNEWKENQIVSTSNQTELPTKLLRELAESGGIDIDEGSFVMSIGQKGGQTAHKITNVGKQPRLISPETQQEMVDFLQQFDPGQVTVTGMAGDGETVQLAEQIISVLERAGWRVKGPEKVVLVESLSGIRIETPTEHRAIEHLAWYFDECGFQVEPVLNPSRNDIEVYVGTNL